MRYLKPRGRPVSLSPLRASLSSHPPPPPLPRFIPRFRYFSLTRNTRLVSKRLTKLLIYSSNLPVPCRIKRQGVLLPPPDGMLVHHKVPPPPQHFEHFCTLWGLPDNSPVPVNTPGCREARWEKVSRPRTQDIDLAWSRTQTSKPGV